MVKDPAPDNFWRSAKWVRRANSVLVQNHSAKARANQRRYFKTAKGRAASLAGGRRANKTEKHRAAVRRYNLTAKGKALQHRTNCGEKGKARILRYVRSEKGRAAHHRHRVSEKGLRRQLRYAYSEKGAAYYVDYNNLKSFEKNPMKWIRRQMDAPLNRIRDAHRTL